MILRINLKPGIIYNPNLLHIYYKKAYCQKAIIWEKKGKSLLTYSYRESRICLVITAAHAVLNKKKGERPI